MRRTLTAIVALIMLAGCEGNGTSPVTPVDLSISGTWTLQTINGKGLAYVVDTVGGITALTDGTVFVVRSGTLTRTLNYTLISNGVVSSKSLNDVGTWSISGTTMPIHFTSDGSNADGTFDGTTLTIKANGFTFVYLR